MQEEVVAMRILVVEDDTRIASALHADLEAQGYAVSTADTAEAGLATLLKHPFDIIILDLSLPDRDGLELLRELRERKFNVPVLILTGRDTVEERIRGLDRGADDYLVKPFALQEVSARIRALLRRAVSEGGRVLRLADLEVDISVGTAIRGGEPIHLSSRELKLLAYLLHHHGEVVSREMLARDVWQIEKRTTPLDNVIEAQVARLRRKVDDPFNVRLIHTVRGLGYAASETPP